MTFGPFIVLALHLNYFMTIIYLSYLPYIILSFSSVVSSSSEVALVFHECYSHVFFLFSCAWLLLIVTPPSMWQVFPDIPPWLSAPTSWLCKHLCALCSWLFYFVPHDPSYVNGLAPCFFSVTLPSLWPVYLLLQLTMSRTRSHLTHALHVLCLSISPYLRSAGSSFAWIILFTPLHDS